MAKLLTAGATVLDNERLSVYHQTGTDAHYRIEVLAPYRNGSHERYYYFENQEQGYEAVALRRILEVMSR
jgi:hypothetical protein